MWLVCAAYCGGVLDARYNGTIYSPGYPSPGYRQDVHCNWLIKVNDQLFFVVAFYSFKLLANKQNESENGSIYVVKVKVTRSRRKTFAAKVL